MGLRLQLGHPIGQQCMNPSPAFGDDFVLIDLTGIHEVAVDYCSCKTARPHPDQLLCARIFPATTTAPKTGATFRVLEHFHLESAQAGVSGQAFYNVLARRTDNIGVNLPKVRCQFFVAYIQA